MPMRDSEGRFAISVAAPTLLIILAVALLPLATTLAYSFMNVELISAHNGDFVGLANYAQVLGSKAFWEALGRTVYFTVASTSIETILGLLIALLLNEEFFGVRFLRSIVIIPWAVPTIVNGSL